MLAYQKQKLYGLVPLLMMAANVAMLIVWWPSDLKPLAIVLCSFSAIYVVGGYLLQVRSREPLIWAALTIAAALGYYLMGYFRLQSADFIVDIPHFWTVLALALSSLSALVLRRLLLGEFPNQPMLQIHNPISRHHQPGMAFDDAVTYGYENAAHQHP